MNSIVWKIWNNSTVLTAGQVHIFRANLNLSDQQLAYAKSIVSDAENARIERLVTSALRHNRLASQSILRDVLARFIDQSPESFEYGFGHHKKPYLIDSAVQFNMTHSQDVALYAVTLNHDIGVDIEKIKSSKYEADIVKSNFSANEFQQYSSVTDEQQQRIAFYRGWTRKEAYTKAIGMGLYQPLDQFSVNMLSNDEPGLLEIAGSQEAAKSWRLPCFLIDTDFIGAIAIQAEINSWFFWDWQRFIVDN